MRDVAIIGVGMQKWGELWDKSLRDIFVESALLAIDDAGVDKIDSLYVGSMAPGLFTGQEHLGALLADYLGYGPIPACRVESACASGALALRQGYIDVASGMTDVVLVGGVEKMMDIGGDGATFGLAAASDRDYEAFVGNTFPALYALMMRAHMEKYGTTREQIAQVAVKNHDNGLLNPHAQYHVKLTQESVINSTMVADPIKLMDCSPITDGAAAVVLVPADQVKNYSNKTAVKILATGAATSTIALHQRKDITILDSVVNSAERAYKMANMSPTDIDIAEVHDCFTISEICIIEALGFCEFGQGGRFTEEGHTSRQGSKPINTSGGLKSKGHPVGATGVAQIHEIVSQLRGEAGKRQVPDAKRGLAQNMGGSGASSFVHILEVM
ncbi:thiolase domain-containing protein [Planctomycetota bacterium]